ncbi:MRP like family ATpase [Cryptosporidium sp. chipmunk genotype I]|uniref:MRP like family ATpase n=1 Tax=Cryptosporidium sp. chipmunk genotype I TaxID=1280935 RepID=UPI003519EC4F|nr:MRP like family ATpase [Cryptosporidium sp. chipmunk genotype I]
METQILENNHSFNFQKKTLLSGGNTSENLTNQLIEELIDPTIFVRSCILRGSKHISKCIENFEIATKYVNDQLEKQIIELGHINTIQSMCNDIVKLDHCSKAIGSYFSEYKSSIEIDTIPIIQKYDNIKDNMLISKRILQIQNLCNRTIEFISLISKLKVQFGLKKSDNEEQYKNFFVQFQNGIPDTVDISKTSKIIVELESMIYFNEENVTESETSEKKINNSIVSSLEFLEVLQEDIKWLRRLSAIYRQYGHKKLLKGIEELDNSSIHSGCVILDQFGELWEHIDTLVEDVILKRLNHIFQVCNLQKCIETADKTDEVFAVSIEYATFSILKVIENALNQVILGLKQLICIHDTLIENKINSSQRTNQMNFVNTFWEKCLLFFENVFNNIYSINSKNPNIHQISFGKEIIVSTSLKLEQLFHLLINCYPEMSIMFKIATKNIKALFSSSSKVIVNAIVNDKNILNTISKIREAYLFSIKERFGNLFESIIPKKNLYDSYEKLSNRISDITREIIKELQRTRSCDDISTQIYDSFRNELLCFMVTCETIIQPEGGIITHLERAESQSNLNWLIESNNLNIKKRLPFPTQSHTLNANISVIAAILSNEIQKIYEIEFTNNFDIIERDRMIELLKSLQYKSAGKWFSQTSLAILELNIAYYYDKNKTSSVLKGDKLKIGQSFVALLQEIVTNFIQNWAPLLYNHDFWSKCYVLLCRNIIIIFLVNFTLRSELNEESCFEIAEEIVSLQSIISHFISDHTIKNLLSNDIKMIQDFRRVLFSDIKSIREAINFSNDTKNREPENSKILWNSINDLDNILFIVHILNRIFYILKKSSYFSIQSFIEHSKVPNLQLSIFLNHLLFIQFNKYPTCESDTDLFIIFNVFKQNANNEYISNPEILLSKIRSYINMIEKELKSNFTSTDHSIAIDDLEVVLNHIKENLKMLSEHSDISENEMDLNDQIIRQLKNIYFDPINPSIIQDNKLRNIIEQNIVKDYTYDYFRGIVYVTLTSDVNINDNIKKELLELGWVNSVNITVEKNTDYKNASIEDKKDEILLSLKKVIDPDLNKDIVSCGFVKDLYFNPETLKVSFTLELTTPICPLKDSFEKNCIEVIKSERSYVKEVNIKFTSKPNKNQVIPKEKTHTNLENVSNIIAISSCKGGVGKSTIAVNTAFTLSKLGAKVGIVDCDLYGPNLEQLIPLESNTVFYKKRSDETEEIKTNVNKRGFSKTCSVLTPNADSREGFIPLVYKGVKLISYSYLLNTRSDVHNANKVSSVLRGPIAGSIVTQLITGTVWEDLDYLILDLPPGTGDIQLSIAQSIAIDGAIIVTTPQDLSIADVERGIHLFNKLNIPIITVVENMSYFICDGCEKKHEIFSRGDFSLITDKYGLECNFNFPLISSLSKCKFYSNSNEVDFPYVIVANKNDIVYLEFVKLSEFIARKMSKNRYSDYKPNFEFDNNRKIVICQIPKDIKDIFVQESAIDNFVKFNVSYNEIRKLCRCAICYEPEKAQFKEIYEPLTLLIDQLETMGSYAITINWSDGHTSIISYYNLIKKFESEENEIKLCQNESLIW